MKLYDTAGKVVGEKQLDPSVFGVAVNPNVVHEVMVGIQANARNPYAHTKTKGEVRGGGKKPWAQKGTGRARQGSSRNPHWIGGGVAFGPRSDRDYTKKINRKMQQRAFTMVLSDKLASDQLILVEKLEAKDGKTKGTAAMLAKLPIKGKIALVNAAKDELFTRSIRNLPSVTLYGAGNIGLVDVIRAHYVVMTPEAAEKFEKTYGSKKAAGKKA
ncbi:MAG TPA: 50S ribosomal protein L4 [Usitatibacter sp.]